MIRDRLRSSFVVLGWASIACFVWMVALAYMYPIGVADTVFIVVLERSQIRGLGTDLPRDLAGELSTRLATEASLGILIVGLPFAVLTLSWAILTWALLRARAADRPLEMPRGAERRH